MSDGDVTTYVYELYFLQYFKYHLNTTWGETIPSQPLRPIASRVCSR